MTSVSPIRNALLVAVALASVAHAEPQPAPSVPDSAQAPAATSTADSTSATDSSAVTKPPPVPPYKPSPHIEALSHFRVDRTADLETVSFGDRADAVEPPGLVSVAGHLRLSPGVRTRELSQGPTAETFDVGGTGSGRSALLLRGASLDPPGTSAPQSNDVMLSEIDGFVIARGGTAALYGPSAADGAVVLLPRTPLPDSLTVRATAEEGVDDWLRGAFQVARRIGPSAGFFAQTETRNIEGFFPGTKEADRHLAASFVGRLPRALEGELGLRHFEGDGRHGGTDPGVIHSVLTKRDDLRAKVFRATGAGGVLVEAGYYREKLETGVGGGTPLTRKFSVPSLRVTADLPSIAGLSWTARGEGEHDQVERVQDGRTERFARGAGALRATASGGKSFATGTARVDLEESRPTLVHGRLEGEWSRGALTLFTIASRGERLPDREAVASDVAELQSTAEAGARLHVGAFTFRGVANATNVEDLRREPTFEEVRARAPVLDAPLGDAEFRSASLGFATERFVIPHLTPIGDWLFRTSVTRMSAEIAKTGARLPGRPSFSWTGEGFVERHFFKGGLLARLRGRLTHLHDRVDTAGDPIVDAWVTDVLLEGEVGDAVFFYRAHDMLERADEIEPGFRLPGFSRMWGVTWRFIG